MKTNFEKIDGRWVVETGNVVAIDYIDIGGGYEYTLADQCIDICTGEKFAKLLDEEASDIVGEPVWYLGEYAKEMPEYKHIRKNFKKQSRALRIDMFCGIHWTTKYQIKRIGKNRKFARRMYPNEKQMKEFGEYLPF